MITMKMTTHSDFKRSKVSRSDQERWWGSKSFRGSDISTSGSSRRGRRRRRKVWEEPRLRARAGRDPPSASRLQHEVQLLGHLLQGELLWVKSPQSFRFDEASLFVRGQDSVKDNLLRFIQWFWNTPSYCYKYLLWFHSLYSDINVTIPGASILKSWKKGTQFANKMENVSLSSTIPVTKVSMAPSVNDWGYLNVQHYN